MKNFLKYTLASFVGAILAAIILGLILFGSIGAMISSASEDKEVEVKENSLLVLKLNKPIVDRAKKNPFSNFNPRSFQVDSKIGLNKLLKNIEKASKDDKIKGIVLRTSGIQAGFGTIDEIRNALQEFRNTGKFIVSHSNVYSQKAYYLASVADTIYSHPEGELMLNGLNAEVLFFENALEKLGVEPVILRHGKFKSAVEPFIMEKMSEANREQIRTYLNSLWGHLVKNLGSAQDISKEKLNLIADNLYTLNINKAQNYGLIDDLVYEDEFINILKKATERKEDEDLRTLSMAKYDNAPEPEDEKDDEGLSDNEIAVVYASGQIVESGGDSPVISGKKYASVIREARKDDDIKAIVFRVNSPGGSALASDMIWREVKLASKEKPVIVSMGNVAASGGYYISCAADTIVAHENTITGSIGVFGMLFNAKELLNDKLGITSDNVKTNKHADLGTITKPVSKEEKQILQKNVDDTYNTFISRVARGRDMTLESVDSIGQGRVWSGINAREIGLVDVFGGMNKAIEIAADKADIKDYRITELPELKDPFKELFKEITGGNITRVLKDQTGKFYYYLDAMKTISKMETIQARLPYQLRIE